MATYSDIAHRWANKDFGKNGSLTAGRCSCNELSFYSYSTVIGQWLDKEKNLIAIIDQSLTKSTGNHIRTLIGAIPKNVTTLYFSISPCYGYYSHVDLLGSRGDFDKRARMRLLNIFIDNLYDSFYDIKSSKTLQSEKIDMKWWNYINKLNEMYNNDASPKTWLRAKIDPKLSDGKRKIVMQKRKMVRGLIEGVPENEIVDSMFGKGTWEQYQERVAPLKKAERSRKFALMVNSYMKADNGWGRTPAYSYKDIKNMSPYNIMLIKFSNIEKQSDEYKKMAEHKKNAYHRAVEYIGLKGKEKEYGCNDKFKIVINRFTGQVIYNLERREYYYDYYEHISVVFGTAEFQSFCQAHDKRHWIKRFYKTCEIKQERILAKDIHTKVQSGERTIDSLTTFELKLYESYIDRKSRHEERTERYEIMVRKKRQAKQEEKIKKLNEYKANGIDGLRNIWRDHLGPIPAECYGYDDYFYGGNVLLRFKNEKIIETSKNIRLSVDVCKRIFPIIKSWHEDQSTFRPTTIQSEGCGLFKITSYKNDILTAGCHDIAYVEMERMYQEIIKLTA